MATPKTPRKSAVKAKPAESAKPDEQVEAVVPEADQTDIAPEADKAGADAETAVKDNPTGIKATPEPEEGIKDSADLPPPDAPTAPQEKSAPIEDAVIVEDPAPVALRPTETDTTTDTPPDMAKDATPDADPAAKADADVDASAPQPSRDEIAPPPPTIVKNSPGFVPLVLGGVVAAGLGFGFAHYVMPGFAPLQAQLAQQTADIQALRAELQALPKADSNTALLAEIGAVRETAASALQAAEEAKTAATSISIPEPAAAADVSPQLAALADRLAAVESRPVDAGPSVDPAVIAQLTGEIDTLRDGLAAQKAAAEALVAEAETVRADAAAKAETVLLKAALTKVEAAIQDGSPYAESLALLTNAGVAIPETLSANAETGVPTTAALAISFADPARAALEAGLRGNMGSTWTDRVGAFLRTQTGARSLTPQDGTDPDAILSRVGAAVTAGDLQTALTEIATLPEPAQAALSAWVDQAKLHLDAKTATVELATALSER
jgi:hypothetical protein